MQDNPFYGLLLTPILTPNLGSFLLLKNSSFNSENGVNLHGLFLLFWSYFNSEGGVKILGTGYLLFWGYFNSSIPGVIFTPQKEFFKLLFGFKITPPKNNSIGKELN